mgnify:CR=1 FL=1
MTTYSFIPTKINLYRGDDSPLFGDSVTMIELDDDGAGIFFKITQDPNEFGPGGTLRFDFNEVQNLFKVIKHLEANVKRIK